MDAREYRNEIISRIEAENANSDDKKEAFLSEIIDNLSEDEVDGFNPCHYEGTWSSKHLKVGFDGYYIGQDDGTLCVFYCAYSGAAEAPVITTTDVGTIYLRVSNAVQAIFDGTVLKAVGEGGPVFSAVTEIMSTREDIQRFRFYIITDAIRGERGIRDIDEDEIDGKPTQLSLFDMQSYYDIMATRNQGTTDVIFEDYGHPEGIQCIRANESAAGAGYDAYLCVMPAKLLSDIYTKYGGRLIESNVRSFLGSKKKVNRGVKKTLATEPEKFFAYNNGISAIAVAIEVSSTEKGLSMTEIHGFQVVNGGQTTALIYNADHPKKSSDRADLSKVFVPMKLCVIPSDAEDEQLVRNISEFSNSQNTISSADFYSNYPVHRKLEQISRRLHASPKAGKINFTRWYYERARGSFVQEQALLTTAAERKKFTDENPKNQCITKTDIAKFWMSYSLWAYGRDSSMTMMPQKVSAGNASAVKVFADAIDKIWQESGPNGVAGARINDNFYKNTVAIALMFRGLETAISDKTQAPWYTSGYRANLVTYSIAKLSYDLDKQSYSVNLDLLWQSQDVPAPVMKQLLTIAEKINDYLNNTQRAAKDTREWCKNISCWVEIERLPIELSKDLGPFVRSSKAVRGDSFRNSRDERVRDRDGDWREVMSKPAAFWQRVLDWGNENQELNKDDRYYLSKATGVLGEGVHPNEKDAQQLMKLLNRLKDGGFTE